MRRSKGRKKKRKIVHTFRLREVKYNYIKKELISLEVTTAILAAFEFQHWENQKTKG